MILINKKYIINLIQLNLIIAMQEFTFQLPKFKKSSVCLFAVIAFSGAINGLTEKDYSFSEAAKGIGTSSAMSGLLFVGCVLQHNIQRLRK